MRPFRRKASTAGPTWNASSAAVYRRNPHAHFGAPPPGIPFAFEQIARSPNTLDAHRLIRWSWSAGCQDAVVENPVSRFFVEGKDIGDRAVLLDVRRERQHGRKPSSPACSTAILTSMKFERKSSRRRIATGVPFFIINGQFGLPGAHSRRRAEAARSAEPSKRLSRRGVEAWKRVTDWRDPTSRKSPFCSFAPDEEMAQREVPDRAIHGDAGQCGDEPGIVIVEHPGRDADIGDRAVAQTR